MMNEKAFWKSKTLWFNALAFLATIATALTDSLPLLQEALPAGAYVWLAIVVSVANIVLRKVTTEGITFGKPQ